MERESLIEYIDLVATVFIDNPSNLPEINHIDENKNKNSVNNLEWCSRLQNVHHSKVWKTNEKAVLQYSLEGNLIKEYQSLSEAARENNVTPQSISISIKNNWKSANFKWKYKS